MTTSAGSKSGSADFSGGRWSCQEYSVASLNMKNLMWCNPYGGMFTNQFWASMDKIGRGNINPDWNSLMTSAGKEYL